MNRPLLSICIPTYNRAHRVVRHIEQLLNVYVDGDVEVVTVDNASTDDTRRSMEAINDPRFRYVRRENNIGGMPNIISCMLEAHGEGTLLVLDKDHVRPEQLRVFMERLRSLPSRVVVGQLSFNVNAESGDSIFAGGFNALRELGYTKEHPSGMLVKTDVLKDSGAAAMVLAREASFAFNPDIIKTRLAMLGDGWRAAAPLVVTETPREAATEVSHTYSDKNLWFAPDAQRRTTKVFMQDCVGLELTKEQMKAMLLRLYRMGLNDCTFGFRSVMRHKEYCVHNGVAPREVGVGEMLHEHVACVRRFAGADLPFRGYRIMAAVYVGVRWFARLIIGKRR